MRRIYREQINIAGGYADGVVYPVFAKSGQRRRRAKATSEVQAKLNERNSAKRLTRLAHANFTERDIATHLTYNEESLPIDEKQAQKDVQKFLRRLKVIYKESGQELKYIWVCEKGEKSKRVHHHLILNSICVDKLVLFKFCKRHGLNEGETSLREIIEFLWDKGFANTKRLRFGDNGIEGLSHYMTKQKLFFKRFNTSKNLIKPTVIEKQERLWHRDLAFMSEVGDFTYINKLYPGYELTGAPQIIENEVNGGFYITFNMKKKL